MAEADGEILGYAYADSFIERAAYDWAVKTTVYVKAEQKGKGIGSRLYDMVWMEKHIGYHVEKQPEVKSFEEIKTRIADQ